MLVTIISRLLVITTLQMMQLLLIEVELVISTTTLRMERRNSLISI